MRRNSSTVLSECRKQLQRVFRGHIIQPELAKAKSDIFAKLVIICMVQMFEK